MILGGNAMKQAFLSGKWKAYAGAEQMPFEAVQSLIRSNSIDVTLSPHILRMPRQATRTGAHAAAQTEIPLDLFEPRSLQGALLPQEMKDKGGLLIKPGDFILGCLNERFEVHEPIEVMLGSQSVSMHFAPMYEGRSTLGRCGIGSHVTAGFGDYGFDGAFTLEMFNIGERAVRIYPNIRIGQISFMAVLDPIPYQGAYSRKNSPDHDKRPVPPTVGRDRFLVRRGR